MLTRLGIFVLCLLLPCGAFASEQLGKRILVPDFKNKTLQQAQSQALAIDPATGRKMFASVIPAGDQSGVVTTQSPTAGTYVYEGSSRLVLTLAKPSIWQQFAQALQNAVQTPQNKPSQNTPGSTIGVVAPTGHVASTGPIASTGAIAPTGAEASTGVIAGTGSIDQPPTGTKSATGPIAATGKHTGHTGSTGPPLPWHPTPPKTITINASNSGISTSLVLIVLAGVLLLAGGGWLIWHAMRTMTPPDPPTPPAPAAVPQFIPHSAAPKTSLHSAEPPIRMTLSFHSSKPAPAYILRDQPIVLSTKATP